MELVQHETNTRLDSIESKVVELENEFKTIKQTSLRIEHNHGEKLQALYEGYINNHDNAMLQLEPRIFNLENTVKHHYLEILSLKNAK